MFCSGCILHYLALGAHSWSRCPLCFESVYPQALKSVRFRLHSRVLMGDALSLVLVQRERRSDALRTARMEPHVRDAFAAAMRDGRRSSAAAVAAPSPSPSGPTFEAALDVDPALDPSLFSRVTFAADVSAICTRELEELSVAAAALLSESGGDSVAYQFLLAAQETVFKRLDGLSQRHADTSQRVRAVIANAHAAQRRGEEEAQAQAQREAALKSAPHSSFSSTSAVAGKSPAPSESTGGRSAAAVIVDCDDAAAWPALGAGGGQPSRADAVRRAQPRPIRTLRPRSPPPADAPLQPSTASPSPPTELSAVTSAALPSPKTASAASAGSMSAALPRSRSAFFDSREEEEAEERGRAPPSLSSAVQALSQSAASAPSPLFPSLDPSEHVLFYQALDGQHVYLHSLCFRALLHDCGNELSRLPACISGRVESIDEGFVERATVERYRFLAHLPSSAPFALVLLALPDLVRPGTVEAFAAEWKAELRGRQRRQAQHQHEQRRKAQQQRHQQRWQEQHERRFSPERSSATFAYGGREWSADPGDFGSEDAEGDADDSFPALHTISAPHSPPSPYAAAVVADGAPRSAQPPLSPAAASGSPTGQSSPAQSRVAVSASLQSWNAVAERGLGASLVWAPLGPSNGAAAAAPPSLTAPVSAAWASKAQQRPLTGSAAAPPPSAVASSAGHRLRFRPLPAE